MNRKYRSGQAVNGCFDTQISSFSGISHKRMKIFEIGEMTVQDKCLKNIPVQFVLFAVLGYLDICKGLKKAKNQFFTVFSGTSHKLWCPLNRLIPTLDHT